MFYSIILESPTLKTSKMHTCYENRLLVVVLIDVAGRQLCCEILRREEKSSLNRAHLYHKRRCYKDRIHYNIYEKIVCRESQILDESKFNLLIYAAVIYFLYGAKYNEQNARC